MLKLISRVGAVIVCLVGLVLLARVLFQAADGSLVDDFFPLSNGSWVWAVSALFLSLPIPLHVVSIGLILQKRWLSARWGRVAWVAIFVSGGWLGIALAVRVIFITN